ncbi:hypothetical protein, partial [Acidaminococcus timonensis]|uniref:hypothetical protein n=1 Tax=Acidaminococcus timonensis TaxID=1871002 RepID=UPI002941FED0
KRSGRIGSCRLREKEHRSCDALSFLHADKDLQGSPSPRKKGEIYFYVKFPVICRFYSLENARKICLLFFYKEIIDILLIIWLIFIFYHLKK